MTAASSFGGWTGGEASAGTSGSAEAEEAGGGSELSACELEEEKSETGASSEELSGTAAGAQATSRRAKAKAANHFFITVQLPSGVKSFHLSSDKKAAIYCSPQKFLSHTPKELQSVQRSRTMV